MVMRIDELKKFLGQKIPDTNLTLLQLLGTNGNGQRICRVQCECGTIRDLQTRVLVVSTRTCAQKECPHSRQLASKAGVLAALASATSPKAKKARSELIARRRNNATLIENKEYNFCLIKTTYSKYIINAKQRGIEWDLTPQDIEQLWIKQEGKCNITGIILSCGTTHKNHTWSLDRIDNNKNYTKGNVQLVSKTYNMIKMSRTDEEMKLMAYVISQNLTHEELRRYNKMTLKEINSALSQCTKVTRA